MGRWLFGIAAVILGAVSLILHAQLVSEWLLPGKTAFLIVTSLVQIGGGLALPFARTGRLGAATLAAVYLVFALTFVRDIVAQPGVYASWGDVFYALALVVGAVVAYGLAAPSASSAKICAAAIGLFGLCNISFAIEQVEFLARTVSLVPKWIPPNGNFWAILTAIAFALAGIALLVRYRARIAAQLLAVMLLIFVAGIWIPILIAAPKTLSNWSEGIETFAIAAVALLVADYLGSRGAKAESIKLPA
ncbi:MAG TPA: hypothetical protein VHX17_08685 [Candidatus Cybelea sp.]|jgi:hypothetical protein|nr:hypothetical protein [Candidatus Cybelea sp.]